MRTGINHALAVYGLMSVDAAVEYSSPAELLNLLFNGLTDSLIDAQRHLAEKRYDEKGAAISKAQNILTTLRGTLDFQVGGELADNLDELYAYCFKALSKAHFRNDRLLLQEVHDILCSLRAAWLQASHIKATVTPIARRA